MKTYPKIYIYNRIVQAKLFIDNNFGDSIDLNNIADEAYFSKYHFIRLFKAIYGKTPHQYLIWVRVEKAKLLLQKDYSISDVCVGVGFESPGSFATLFKQYTKISPSVYQQNFKTRQALIKEAPLRFIPHCFAEQKGWIKNSNFQELPS
ncbi:MAG TPA: AraC family transcriptional regulator [Segetibacter sp.]|jgi:AraC-like DNA-binding protein